MKIDNSVKPLDNLRGNSPAKATQHSPVARTAAPAGAAATVELSSLAGSLQAAEAGAVESSFNAEKVAEIKKAISEGRFQINPDRIAEGLISSVRDMLADRQGTA